MLKVIFNRLKPQAREIIAEEQVEYLFSGTSGSEPEPEVPEKRYSTSESCVKSTSSINKICTVSS